MSFLFAFLGVSQQPSRNADDDRWWGGAATQSMAGVSVDVDAALKISAVWACVRLLSETIASLPLNMYQRRSDGGRELAPTHPLQSVLHDQPNANQTSIDFRNMMTGHVLLRGDAYAEIVPGARGAVDQLLPIHPDRVTVERLAGGRLRYQVRQNDGARRPYNQESIFHLRGPSRDGLTGMSIIDYARDSFGVSLAAEHYGSRFFRSDSRPGGILKTLRKLSPEAKARLKSQWQSAHSGGNQSRVAVLEEGVEWQSVGVTPEQAQFLGTREFHAEDVCRWFGVPPHMIGLTSKATSWGSGIEEMGIGFVTYTLLPWLTRWQQTISKDLIIAPGMYFAAFTVEGLLRGDIGKRYGAYATARQWGWMSVNDIRRLENMNPVDGGDVYLQPMNMLNAGEGDRSRAEAQGRRELASGEHYRLLAEEAAGRLVRKEMAAVMQMLSRGGSHTDINDFYGRHANLVAQTLRVPFEVAQNFCLGQAASVRMNAEWRFDVERLAAHLATLAMESVAKANLGVSCE